MSPAFPASMYSLACTESLDRFSARDWMRGEKARISSFFACQSPLFAARMYPSMTFACASWLDLSWFVCSGIFIAPGSPLPASSTASAKYHNLYCRSSTLLVEGTDWAHGSSAGHFPLKVEGGRGGTANGGCSRVYFVVVLVMGRRGGTVGSIGRCGGGWPERGMPHRRPSSRTVRGA